MTDLLHAVAAEAIAEALGCTARAVRQRAAREKWPSRAKRANGGRKLVFEVAHLPDDVTSALAVRRPPRGRVTKAPVALAKAPERHRKQAAERARLVESFEEFARRSGGRYGSVQGAMERFLGRETLADGEAVSVRTLHRWRTAYRERGIAGLLPRVHRCGRKPKDWPVEAKDLLKALWLSENRRSKQFAIRRVREAAKHEDWDLPSDTTMRKFLEDIPEGVKIWGREGRKAYEQKALPYVERDYDQLQVNDVWVGDHCQLDIFVIDDKGRTFRPWLTAWQDCKSRRLVGHRVVRQASSDSIVASFVQAAADAGVPNHAYMDNGSDYASRRVSGGNKRFRQSGAAKAGEVEEMSGLFSDLGITTLFAIPANGRAKIVERFFRTMKLDFEKAIEDGYVGSNPQERPEGADRARRRGDLLTFDEVRRLWGRWVEDVYNRSPHSGRGMNNRTPNQVWTEALDEGLCPRFVQPATLSLLLRKTKQLKLGRQGLSVEHRYFDSSELRRLVGLGELVLVRYDAEALDSHVHVCKLDGTYLCEADYIAPTGFLDRNGIEVAKRRQKELRGVDEPEIREVRERQAALAREGLVLGVPTIDEAAKRPQVVGVARTVYDADARQIVRGEEQRKREDEQTEQELAGVVAKLAAERIRCAALEEADEPDFDCTEALRKGLEKRRARQQA